MDKISSKQQASAEQKLYFRLFKLLRSILRCLDVRIIAAFGKMVGLLAWMLLQKRRRIVARNLRIVIDPTLSDKELRPLVRRNIMLTCMNFACALKVGVMNDKEFAKSVSITGGDFFEKHGAEGHTCIACIPHAGNWEALARIRPIFKNIKHFGSMYRQLSNPLLEELIYQSRTNYGCEMHSKESGLKNVLRMARTGGFIGILSDQYTNEGLHIPYFGKITGTTPLPALLHKACRGKGTYFAVSTRNTGLGKWDVSAGNIIKSFPAAKDKILSDSISINLALEKLQESSILDGFWMHHRWKCTSALAPNQKSADSQLVKEYTRLPFRVIIAVPEEFEEALCCLPAIRCIQKQRFDFEVTVVVPQAQLAFWKTLSPIISNVIQSDGKISISEQMRAKEIYDKGPFDYLFMWSESKKTLKELCSSNLLYVCGFKENPLSEKFNFSYNNAHCDAPQHRTLDYLNALNRHHSVSDIKPEWTAEHYASQDVEVKHFIAPFSSLGTADHWPEEEWSRIIEQIPSAIVLALEDNRDLALNWAKKHGIKCQICKPEEINKVLGNKCRVISVDGLIAQLADFYGATVICIMASRLPARYRPMGEHSFALNKHLACHPCYRDNCDASPHCASQMHAKEVLFTLHKMTSSL